MAEKSNDSPGIDPEAQGVKEREGHSNFQTKTEQIHEYHEEEGYVVEVDSEGGAGSIKLAKDGHTRLIPQPSDDPNDPLNWSWKKKNLMLTVISMTAFLPDYGSATGAGTLIVQALYVVSSPQIIDRGLT